MKIKTPKDISRLNFNDVAFFYGISTTDAKFKILQSYNLTGKELADFPFNKSGVPKIGINDFVNKKDFDFKMKSCSFLEGKNHIDYHIEIYNKRIPRDKIREFAETKGFITALRFTGKYQILNEILNREDLLLLQKKWVLKNLYNVKRWSEKCIKFIETNPWTFEYLSKYISVELELEKQKNLAEES